MTRTTTFKIKTLSVATIAGLCLHQSLYAEELGFLEEVIVTAQKRQQNVQEVPASITAMDSGMLEALGVDRVQDLNAMAPNLDVNRNINIVNVFVRGVGSAFLGPGADNSVAVHVDGAYIQSSRALRGSFFDVDRIEVLRGPQGTLYGRNATGGSVNIINRKPTEELDAFARVTLGDYERIEFEGAVGGKISDSVLGRLSVTSKSRDGFGTNVFNGREIDDLNEDGIRGQLSIAASDKLNIHLSADHFTGDAEGYGWHTFGSGREGRQLLGVVQGSSIPDDRRDVNQDIHPRDELDITGLSATLTYELDDNISLKSISAYRKVESFNETEIDGTDRALGGPLRQTLDTDWFSEELQFLYSDDRLNAILGLYYFNQESEGQVILDRTGAQTFLEMIGVPFPGVLFPNKILNQQGTLDTEAYAVFGNFEYAITDNLSAILGLRYSYEEKISEGREIIPAPAADISQVTFDIAGEQDWSDFTPELTLQYRFNDDVSMYAKYGEGFKSGTFLIGTSNGANLTGQTHVDPEQITSFEVGLKSRLFDDHFQANLSAFYYDFEDIQINRIVVATVFVENVPEATMQGIEAEFLAQLTDGLQGVLTFGLLDSEFGDVAITDPVSDDDPVNIEGNPVPGAPEMTANFALTQSFSLGDKGNLSLMGQVRWQDKKYFTVFKREPESQDAYAEYNASLTWTSPEEKWAVTAWGRNLSDEEAVTFGTISARALGYPILGTLNEPRTVGMDVQVNF